MENINYMELAEQIVRGEVSEKDSRVLEAEKFLRELASTEDGRQEIAETIALYIDTNFNKFDISPYITDSKSFRLGDKPEFRLKKKGIKAYWISPNSSTPKSRNYQEVLSMEFDSLSVRPEVLIDELKAGRIGSLAELVADSETAMKNAIAGKVFTILGQVYNETKNAEYFAQDTTALAKATLDNAIDKIFYKTGKRPVIIGDMMLTNQIMSFAGFTPEALEEIRKTGKIGVYRGATILALPEVIDETSGVAIVPQNRLYVVSSKIGYSATYGDSKSGQETSIEDWTWNARIDKEWGMTVTEPKGMFVIEVL